MLVLLAAVVTGAWAADKLYLVVDGTSATLKYDSNKGENDPYYSSTGFGSWTNAGSVKTTATTITVDATCENYQGTSLVSLFSGFTALTVINNLENLNTANVTNISSMFKDCSSLTTLDLSSFNTAKVTQLQLMFNGCSSLTTLDLSSFNTSIVTNMNMMFNGCSLLESIYVGDGWNTDNVTSSNGMFGGCTKLPNYASSKVDKTNAHTGEGGYLKLKVKTYKVTLQEGTEDATNWTIEPAEAAEGATVTATYSGEKKVKSVKAVKKAAAVPTAAKDATAEDVGKVMGQDGMIYDNKAAAEAAGTTAVAMIAYVGDNGEDAPYNHGLALALTDESSTMQWEAAKTACNTTKNTSIPVTNAKWLLASKDQWGYMSSAVLSNIGLQVTKYYWSSTYTSEPFIQAWAYQFSNNSWDQFNGSNSGAYNRVRACLAF